MPYQLTPAQIELQAARRAAKLAPKPTTVPKLTPQELERRKFLKRPWITVRESSAKRRVRIVTWNLLAQTLVRRELFPGSDCLKWGERKPMFLAEFEHHSSADILCLQECDRLQDFLPSLPDHSYASTSGHGKLHGLVVLYRSSRFKVKAQRTIYLDEEELCPAPREASSKPNETVHEEELLGESSNGINGWDEDLGRRRGSSRITKNVGLIVALEDVNEPGQGVVIATTHLFWHPKFNYERVRQLIVLLRAVNKFKSENKCDPWPTVLAGDLNTTPCEATYQLLTNPTMPLPYQITEELETSRFVHSSIDRALADLQPNPRITTIPQDQISDPSQTQTEIQAAINGSSKNGEDDDEEAAQTEAQDDNAVKRTRRPIASDGILPLDELIAMLSETLPKGLESAYDISNWKEEEDETFENRGGFKMHFESCPQSLMGRNEPGYTCYTALFKLTLDYLLLVPNETVTVTGLLKPAQSGEMGGGLPKKGICASDHLAVGCEIAW